MGKGSEVPSERETVEFEWSDITRHECYPTLGRETSGGPGIIGCDPPNQSLDASYEFPTVNISDSPEPHPSGGLASRT